jgi:hypothetical protein
VTDALRAVDFVARFAEAWDCRGRHVFRPPFEHRALVAMSGMRPEIAGLPWRHIKPEERNALMYAARRVVELGRQCAWCFGEGEGARS